MNKFRLINKLFSNRMFTSLVSFIICYNIFVSFNNIHAANLPLRSNHPQMLLTEERINNAKAKISSNDEIYNYFIGQIERRSYPDNPPYYGAIVEYVTGNALMYVLLGEKKYLEAAKGFLWDFYINGNISGWDYKSRNGFRWYARGALLAYDWIYNGLSEVERNEAQKIFKIWGDYWIEHLDYYNSFEGHSVLDVDSDENTTLTETFLMLGLALYGDDNPSAQLYLEVSDALMDKYVLGMYMNDSMKGGLWAEGSHYSGYTQQFWIRSFLMNKESRGIEFPNSYIEDVIMATIHCTFPGFTGYFSYNDIQNATTDYFKPSDHSRFDMMVYLVDAASDSKVKAMGQDWINQCISNGYSSSSGNPGVTRMIFEKSNNPTAKPEDDIFFAEGLGFVSMRDNWGINGTVVYTQNSKWSVDHMHFDALSFDIIRKGVIVTKEVSGYNGPANDSISHNTLYLENPEGKGEYPAGNSSPYRRPLGQGSVNKIDSTDYYGYVEMDAAPIYNYSDWKGPQTIYDFANRKIVFIKPNYLIVYDYIQQNLNPGVEAYRDRFKKYFQHFQVQPIEKNGSYYASSEGQTLYFKTLLPKNPVTSIVDESVMYTNSPYTSQEYMVPSDQRKWHIEVTTQLNNRIERFFHVLYFDDASVLEMPLTESLDISGGMVGAVIKDPDENYITCLNSGVPNTTINTNVAYSVFTTAKSRHIIIDLTPSTKYSVSVSNGNSYDLQSNDKGILTFTNSSIGNHTYTISKEGTVDSPLPPAPVNLQVVE